MVSVLPLNWVRYCRNGRQAGPPVGDPSAKEKVDPQQESNRYKLEEGTSTVAQASLGW